jgi:hypothetical protein
MEDLLPVWHHEFIAFGVFFRVAPAAKQRENGPEK